MSAESTVRPRPDLVRLSDSPSRRGVGRAAATYLRPHRWTLIVALLTNVVSCLLVIAAPVLVGRIADAILATQWQTAIRLGWLGVALAVGAVVTAVLGRSWLARAGEYVVRDVRDRVVDQLTEITLRFVERHRTGELLRRSTAEIAALSAFVRDSLTEVVVTGATVGLMIVVLFIESWVLMLVTVACFVPAGLWVLHRFRRVAPEAFAAEAVAEAELTSCFAEWVRARQLLVATSPEGKRFFRGILTRRNDEAVAAQVRTAVISRWLNALVVIEALTLVPLLIAGTVLIGMGWTTVGGVITFVLAGQILFAGFSDLSALVGEFEEAATLAARTSDLLHSTRADTSPVREPARIAGTPEANTLVVENVTFGYDDTPVLAGLSLRFEPGERVGLAGRTGAGKSTLAKLLAGLYAPNAGRVRFGQHDLATLAADQRVRMVALVPQQVYLGDSALADELRLADQSASDSDLMAAAASVGLAAWVRGLPAGLATQVGKDGALSAGERQLVALIRVAILDSRVLILDEATSDIDPHTARLAEEAINRLGEDRTVIVVAHRAETLARLETRYLVESGGVRRIESGGPTMQWVTGEPGR